MNKNRISAAGVLQSADCKPQQNPVENIPVILVIGLCLFAVSIFSSQSNLIQEDLTVATDNHNYVWISGSSEIEEGLYILSPEQLQETFPELLPHMALTSGTPELDSKVSAFQYTSGLPQPVYLPPAVASIFFKPISINRAEKEILSTLPGIGPKLAEQIILRRINNGPYRSKDELLHITGIGPKKLALLVDHIILD